MLSLAYRIASMPILLRQGTLQENVDADTRDMSAVPKINLDNISDFFLNNQRNEWYLAKDVPNWAPPFARFWAEWRESNPPTDVVKRQLASLSRTERRAALRIIDETWMQVGAMVNATEIDDKMRGGLAGFFAPLSLDMDAVTRAKTIGTAKWGLRVVFFAASNSEPFRGKPGEVGAAVVLVKEDGSFGCHAFINSHKHNMDSIQSCLVTLGLGISFMHCKNVRQVEEQRDQGDRWHKQYKTPRYTYRRLLIDPMKEVLRREGKSDEVGLQRALHICRGHFATYTEEKPLFGKRAGTFWIPDHVRGSKEAGEVQKDYTVAAPEES